MPELTDDIRLLNLMLSDSKNQSLLYQPGKYWYSKTKSIENGIKRCGIQDFRGSMNLVGFGYTDSIFIDARNGYNYGVRRLARELTRIYPLNKIYESQIQLTKSYATKHLELIQERIRQDRKVKNLIEKYNVPYSLLGGCLNKVKIGEHTYSIHYLNLLEQHNYIASLINFNKVRTVFEIGGGFGTNIHLLLENYPNIRKVLYLDIPPNLYTGTQYLRAFYGTSVYDYRDLEHLSSIQFSGEDNLEILCIAPWQIEKFDNKIDILLNSNSFVEMPPNVVNNYVSNFNRLPESNISAIALTTYGNFDPKSTIQPKMLPYFFKGREFQHFEESDLLDISKKNIFFVSPGRYGFGSRVVSSPEPSPP